MPEAAGAVSLEEFWRGLEARGVEPDMIEALRARATGTTPPISRIGDEALVVAVAERLLPGAVPPGVLAAFLDARFDTQLGRGDERVGVLPRDRLIPAGFAALEGEARRRHDVGFVDIDGADQDRLLQDAEEGSIRAGEGVDLAEWFRRVRDVLVLGYGADPRGMVEMGFPGPSYATGHVWLGEHEVAKRADRAPGYETL
jgi:hypothetical protein